DTGATSSMTPHPHFFKSYRKHIVPIRVANGEVVGLGWSAGIGSLIFEAKLGEKKTITITISDVLHVPKLYNNLLSVFKL
ncbi:hypothetical protein BT69DRAFT_1193168, partial [Atractiella rhizophila]